MRTLPAAIIDLLKDYRLTTIENRTTVPRKDDNSFEIFSRFDLVGHMTYLGRMWLDESNVIITMHEDKRVRLNVSDPNCFPRLLSIVDDGYGRINRMRIDATSDLRRKYGR